MRRYVLLPLLLASLAAHASGTLRVGSQVLSVGESVSRAVQLLGEPGYKEPLENEQGAYLGERWQYQRDDGHVVTVVIMGGRVVSIEERSA